jgi:hypothetical protein
MDVCKGFDMKVFVKDLAEINFGILLREVLINFSSFFNKLSLTNGNLIKSHYTSTQRHTLGMWSLPLLNDELGLYPIKSRFVCPNVEKKGLK